MAEWYSDIEDKIYTIVRTRMQKTLAGYNIHYTSTNENTGPSVFPTFYLHELTPMETGNDLENITVNAVMDTVEIVVYDTNRSRCKTIMNEAVKQMKALAYNSTAMPIPLRSDNVYTSVARFRRVIGADDFQNL